MRTSLDDGGDSAEADARYNLPATLTETALVTPVSIKPLALLRVLHKHHEAQRKAGTVGATIVFTSTVESTHRLFRLLQLCVPALSYSWS